MSRTIVNQIKHGCCGYRKIQAGQAWSDYVKQVKAYSWKTRLTDEEQARLDKLKRIAVDNRKSYHEHMDDPTLVHQ